jgi:WD40 repeat protein
LCLPLPALAADPPVKRDRYGDPLPPGALMRLGTLRNRAPITSFGIEKDGTVVTVGPGAEVRRWHKVDDRSDEPIQLPLKGPANTNNYPQVSPDGKLVAACSREKVFVWEVPTDAKAKPKEVAAFDINYPRLFRFSPDGTKLAVTTEKFNNPVATLHFCDIKTGKVTDLELGTAQYFEGIHFSGDGKRLAAVADYELMLWDLTTGKRLAKNRTEGRMFSAFALNHAGDLLVAPVSFARKEDEWRFMDPLTGKKIDGLTGPKGRSWVAFAPDGKALLAGDRAGVEWWDPAAGKLIRRFEGVAAGHYSLQETPARLTPDGKVLVAHNGYAVLRWDAETGKALFPEQDIGHGSYVNGVGFSPDGKLVATRAGDSRLCVWDAGTGKELWHAPAQWTHSPHIDFSPDSKFLYVGGPKWAEATKYDAATGKAVRKFTTDPKEAKQSGVGSLRLAKDGKTLFGLSGPVVVGDPSFVTTWDTATGERVKSTKLAQGEIMTAAELSPGAMFLARGFFNPGVVEVGAPSKDLLKDAKIPGFPSFRPAQFSGDGQWLTRVYRERIEGGERYSAVVISTANWGVACTIPMSKDGIAALSDDGRTLAVAAGEDIEFYDVATSKLLGAYRVAAGGWQKAWAQFTHVLRFTPDGTKLVTGHNDTTALVWPVPRPGK